MSKGKLIGFGVLTFMLCASQGASGVMDLLQKEFLVDAMNALGYPLYVLTILGIFKILGAIVIAIPGVTRLKEWAYAGFFFDFTGAAASHTLNGDGPDLIMPPLVLLAVALGGYFLRPPSRKLAGPTL